MAEFPTASEMLNGASFRVTQPQTGGLMEIALVEVDWREPGPASRFCITQDLWDHLQQEPLQYALVHLYKMARQNARLSYSIDGDD